MNKPRRKEPKQVFEYALPKELRQRALAVDQLMDAVDQLPIDKDFKVAITTGKETARTKQKRLAHRWHRQWELHNGEDPGWGHASTKLEILLPIKLASDDPKTVKEAELEMFTLENLPSIAGIPDYRFKLRIAHDLIRSNDIPMVDYGHYLTAYKRIAQFEGCFLKSQKDIEDEALMRYAESAA